MQQSFWQDKTDARWEKCASCISSIIHGTDEEELLIAVDLKKKSEGNIHICKIIYVFLICWIYWFMWPKKHKNQFHLISNLYICPSTRHFLSSLNVTWIFIIQLHSSIPRMCWQLQKQIRPRSLILQNGNIHGPMVHTSSCQSFGLIFIQILRLQIFTDKEIAPPLWLSFHYLTWISPHIWQIGAITAFPHADILCPTPPPTKKLICQIQFNFFIFQIFKLKALIKL